MTEQQVTIALLGCGTVGGGVLELLHNNAARMAARVGAPLRVKHVLVQDGDKPRTAACDRRWLTTDAQRALGDPEVDVVVEVVGGDKRALHFIEQAIAHGKSVVTANKLVLASHGAALLAKASAAGVDLAFEGAVGGGMPIVRTLRAAFAGDRVTAITGILNGTSNYVLTRMLDTKTSFADAVSSAQQLGYAEADPSMDVDGLDAAHKLAVLALLGFGAKLDFSQLSVEGISDIEAVDHDYAQRFGFCIKHLVIGRDHGEALEMRVHAALIPQRSVLANVSGVLNAVLLEGEAVGPSLVYGRGAGALPTAVSVVGDVMDVSRSVLAGAAGLQTRSIRYAKRPVRAMSEVRTRYYLRFTVHDEPGVLATIAGSLGRQQVSIEQLVQAIAEPHAKQPASVVMLTHRAREGHLQAALDELASASFMAQPARMLRIEEV